VREISAHVGGPQTFFGPTVAIPYAIPPRFQTDTAKHGMYLVFPARATAALKTATEERRRSLFKVPVFQAELKLDGAFDLAGVPAAAPQGAELDWSGAEIVVGVSDARGALADATLTVDGKSYTPAPAEIAEHFCRRSAERAVQAHVVWDKGCEFDKAGRAVQCVFGAAIFRRATDRGAGLRQDDARECARGLAESGI
jgi:inner membrane protein involved in colicin E2 resistance